MHLPTNIIIQYVTYRNFTNPFTVNYHILYDEQKEIIDKLDLKNIIPIEESTSNLLLKLDVKIYDLSIETMILGILNNLFQKTSSIDNISNVTNKSTITDEPYITKQLTLKDLIYSFYQFVRNKGHFARDMKKVVEQWDIALNNKKYLAFSEDVLQDEEIAQLQKNRISNSNDKFDNYFHFSVDQSIYNSLYSISTQNADDYYFIFYRINNTNNFYKFVMTKGKDYKEFQEIQNKYNYIKIDFEEAIDRCNLFYELERECLESITKEQIEAVISNFVLINGGKKKFKDYIKNPQLKIFNDYDWNLQLEIATLNANKMDSSYAVKCSEFCPFYENCNPLEDSMIQTMKNRKPIEAKECNIEYTEFYQARDKLREIIERIIL